MTSPLFPDMNRIAIFGAGLSGRAAYIRAQNLGISCVIDDDYLIEHDDIAADDFTPWTQWEWSQIDTLILSPGIAHHHPAPHKVAQAALAHQVEIISEVEFGLRTGNWGTLIIITGTNGKSTTTALTGHLLEKGGKSVAIGGNIGMPLCALNEAGEDGITVLELSSYQLETTPSLAPDIAALLNITPDHLDRHGGLDGYIAAKTKSLTACPPDALALIGDEGPIMAKLHHWATDTLPCRLLRISGKTAPDAVTDNHYLAGAHNAQNAAFACAIAKECGIKDADIEDALKSFIGLNHRLQPVGHHADILFVNDSKATNGDATAKALGAYNDIIWLAGGRAKADGLSACTPYFSHIHHAYFYGECADAFYEQAKSHIACTACETMDDAFSQAIASLPDKAVILLSPAAASFDQFANFSARGSHFMRLANDYLAGKTKEVSHVG